MDKKPVICVGTELIHLNR